VSIDRIIRKVRIFLFSVNGHDIKSCFKSLRRLVCISHSSLSSRQSSQELCAPLRMPTSTKIPLPVLMKLSRLCPISKAKLHY
jgi:hypothetical protein